MALALRGILFVLLLTAYIAKRTRSRYPSNLPLPPGPKGFPLLGVALSIDASNPWLTYFQWRKLFGERDVRSGRLPNCERPVHPRRPRLCSHHQHGHTCYKLRKSGS